MWTTLLIAGHAPAVGTLRVGHAQGGSARRAPAHKEDKEAVVLARCSSAAALGTAGSFIGQRSQTFVKNERYRLSLIPDGVRQEGMCLFASSKFSSVVALFGLK